ncbi:PREDICTED: cell death activator CIDE-A isoform X4 [Hipposideros armiger]|uniref:Lipid transferase CIDEA n=1 Tax=Hipposideros armiger TaxID=186990 RepID=A0A8B7Q3L4_HIPAR|nr:PREDICTED: cell death activator CIDE-A isoform X4 [Hipposideros armiger]
METARDYAGALIRPLTFMGSQTKRVLLTPLMHSARPFRVSNHDRSSRRGVMASSLKELLSKTLDALLITSGLVTLVLEEDGTMVDTEEFFQTLRDNTHFMILEKGQKWTPEPAAIPVTCCPGDWTFSYIHGEVRWACPPFQAALLREGHSLALSAHGPSGDMVLLFFSILDLWECGLFSRKLGPACSQPRDEPQKVICLQI